MSRSAILRSEPKRLLERAAELVPEGAIIARDQAQALIEKVVKMSKADEISVNLNSGYQTDVRFAANQMSTSGGVVNGQVAIQSAFGKKHAAAVTNDFSDESLRRTVAQSEALAKLSPDDPETMPGLPP
ncbi:MAG TPA: DNA gyrase modulator, partial [Gemmatimonadaceae bacterium]|nr:DNA gyrase modulator [Gemmatimonadaceae bacterium]